MTDGFAANPLIKDFSEWVLSESTPAGTGRSEKAWIRAKDGSELGLFKFPKSDNTTEHVSEHLASRLGSLLDVPTANVEIGYWDGRIGSFSYALVDSAKQDLREGLQYILRNYPEYDENELVDKRSGLKYCIQMIFETYNGYFTDYWVQMMLFDFLIGNSDRHQGNWAYLLPANIAGDPEGAVEVVTPCPLYDNGSSLCSYVNDEQVRRYLSKDRLPFESFVNRKSLSVIRTSGLVRKRQAHAEVAVHLLSHYQSARVVAERFISCLTKNAVDSLVSVYSGNLLDEAKSELLCKYLLRKREILEGLVVDHAA